MLNVNWPPSLPFMRDSGGKLHLLNLYFITGTKNEFLFVNDVKTREKNRQNKLFFKFPTLNVD